MSLFLIKIQKVKKKKSQAAKGKKKTFRFTRVLALVYIKNIQLLINVTIIAENKLTTNSRQAFVLLTCSVNLQSRLAKLTDESSNSGMFL